MTSETPRVNVDETTGEIIDLDYAPDALADEEMDAPVPVEGGYELQRDELGQAYRATLSKLASIVEDIATVELAARRQELVEREGPNAADRLPTEQEQLQALEPFTTHDPIKSACYNWDKQAHRFFGAKIPQVKAEIEELVGRFTGSDYDEMRLAGKLAFLERQQVGKVVAQTLFKLSHQVYASHIGGHWAGGTQGTIERPAVKDLDVGKLAAGLTGMDD